MNQRTQRIATVLVVIALGTVSFFVWQERSHPERPAPISELLGISESASMFDRDISEWTPLIRDAIGKEQWGQLAKDLARLSRDRHEIYLDQHLDYLHARTLIEAGELDDASMLLEPYLAPASPFRVLALQHAERIAAEQGDRKRASDLRRELIHEFPDSYWQEGALEREIESLNDDPRALISFSMAFRSSIPLSFQREVDSLVVKALFDLDRQVEAVDLGFDLLEANVMDDAAELVWQQLDRPSLQARYDPQKSYLLARTAHGHRHFDRAVEILSGIESKIPGKADEIRFDIGRAHYWNRDYPAAEAAYRRGATLARTNEQKAIFYYHAARAAQLRGHDDDAEEFLTRSIAVPGRFDATAASLTQRMRTRLDQLRFTDASHDVHLLRQLFPRGNSRVDASFGYAVAAVAAGDEHQALETLGTIPKRSTDAYDRAAITYWRGRAFEPDDPLYALDEYLDVLKSDVPTHYKWFARERLEKDELQQEIDGAIARRRPKIRLAIASGDWEAARELQYEVVLMRPDPEELDRLRTIYEKVPDYAEVLTLRPAPLPQLPLTKTGTVTAGASLDTGDAGKEEPELDRGIILMALGLDEEAVDRIPEIYPLRPARSALTRSLAMQKAGATKPSIYAIEVMMKSIPDDYVPELLPLPVRQLLHPLYFEDLIREASEEYGADPVLLRSIMREESRFDPRARSFASARGLLQFIISTAKEIGESIGLAEIESSDLYDPETIIDLGAKYVADLLEQFDGNRYRTTAAYNAGPDQAALWSRLASEEGDDYFYAAINFDETRHYVRKVLNTYRSYEGMYPGRTESATEEATDEPHRTDSIGSQAGDEGPREDADGNAAPAPGGAEE